MTLAIAQVKYDLGSEKRVFRTGQDEADFCSESKLKIPFETVLSHICNSNLEPTGKQFVKESQKRSCQDARLLYHMVRGVEGEKNGQEVSRPGR